MPVVPVSFDASHAPMSWSQAQALQSMSTMLAVPFAFDVAAAQVLGAGAGADVERGRRRQRRLGHRLGPLS